MILLFSIACLSEETTLSSWTGYMYQQTLEEDDGLALFSSGTISLLDLEGNLLTEATNPYEGSPFYWQFSLEDNVPLWVMSMDLRKGFDTVDHARLLEALKMSLWTFWGAQKDSSMTIPGGTF